MTSLDRTSMVVRYRSVYGDAFADTLDTVWPSPDAD